ncbi:hypothetical protein CHU98_g8370 [Xylaria longipes]|nr:hypothetical protein CHU98_g8370 [Xylaria longipes]
MYFNKAFETKITRTNQKRRKGHWEKAHDSSCSTLGPGNLELETKKDVHETGFPTLSFAGDEVIDIQFARSLPADKSSPPHLLACLPDANQSNIIDGIFLMVQSLRHGYPTVSLRAKCGVWLEKQALSCSESVDSAGDSPRRNVTQRRELIPNRADFVRERAPPLSQTPTYHDSTDDAGLGCRSSIAGLIICYLLHPTRLLGELYSHKRNTSSRLPDKAEDEAVCFPDSYSDANIRRGEVTVERCGAMDRSHVIPSNNKTSLRYS